MNLEEKTLKEEYIYKGRIINLRVDDIVLPNGENAKREVVEHNGGVCVAPLTEDNCLLFVRQFRYPYKEVVLELPAGKLEKGENAYDAGVRELTEETGAYADGEMIDNAPHPMMKLSFDCPFEIPAGSYLRMERKGGVIL